MGHLPPKAREEPKQHTLKEEASYHLSLKGSHVLG